MDNNLLQGLSDVALEEQIEASSEFPSLKAILEAEKARRVEAQKLALEAIENAKKKAQAQAELGAKVEKLLKVLPDPNLLIGADIRNIHIEIVDILDEKTKALTGREYKAIFNFVTKVTSSGSQAKVKTDKIRVWRIDESGTMIRVGAFVTGVAACQHLNIDYGAGSAIKALRDHKYIVEDL